MRSGRQFVFAAVAGVLLMLPCAFSGCSAEEDPAALPGSAVELHQVVIEARDEATMAFVARDEERSEAAADLAEAASAKLHEVLDDPETRSEDDEAMLAEAVKAARESRNNATLVREMDERERMLGGTEVRAYETARGEALGLALGDATLDWTAVRSSLDEADPETSKALALILGTAYLLEEREDLALAEMQRVRPTGHYDEDQERILLTSLVYVSLGWRRLAVQEVGRVPDLDDAPLDGEMLRGGIHLVSAYLALADGQYGRADYDLVEAVRYWPSNPVIDFLTAEHLAATGDVDAASVSFERFAATTNDNALAAAVADRARRLREDPAAESTLMTDSAMLRMIALESLADVEAGDADDRARKWTDDAQAIGREMMDRLPAKDDSPSGSE